MAINIISVWQPCRPWPVSVPLSELSEVLVPPWLSLALVPLPVPPMHGTSSVAVLLWPLKLCQRTSCCKTLGSLISSGEGRVAGASCPERRHWNACPANCMSSLAGSCARTWQTQCTSASSAGTLTFSPFCDEGTSFFRGHFKPAQDLCLASLLLDTKLLWLCWASVNFSSWWHYFISCWLNQVQELVKSARMWVAIRGAVGTFKEVTNKTPASGPLEVLRGRKLGWKIFCMQQAILLPLPWCTHCHWSTHAKKKKKRAMGPLDSFRCS